MYENKEISINSIQSLTHCSKRTAYNDVDEIIILYGDILSLEFTNNHLIFEHISFGNYHYVLQQIMRQSVDLNLLKEIFYNPNISVSNLSMAISTSESHVYRILEKMRRSLQKYNIYITERKLSFETKDEKSLRLFFTEFLYLSGFIQEDQDAYRTIDDYMENRKSSFINYKMNNHGKVRFFFILYLHVSFIRKSQGYKKMLLITENFNMTYKIRQAYPLLTQASFNGVLNQFKVKKSCNILYENKAILQFKFRANLNKFGIENDVLDDSETLMNMISFFTLVCTVKHPPKYVLERAERFGSDLGKHKPIFYRNFTRCLQDTFSDYVSHNIILKYRDVLVFIFMIDNPAATTVSKKHVLIYSDLGQKHVESLLSIMGTHFPEHKYACYLENKDNDFDYLLSTVLLEEVDHEKTILVDDFFSEQDIFKIFHYLYYEQDANDCKSLQLFA